jgi:hypothetical protein
MLATSTISDQQREAICSSIKADAWRELMNEKAFEWWYFDALSDDARETVVVTFSDNYVFSPRYAAPIESTADLRPRFPAVSFIYAVDGRRVFHTINEYSGRHFRGDKSTAGCTIGDSSFRVDTAAYGTGYVVVVDVPVSPNRRLRATFEWLSIEADLLPDAFDDLPSDGLHWNMVAPRSDVSGRIELIGPRGNVKRVFHFRGTGLHDHVSGNAPLHDSISSRCWGRAHYADATAVFLLECRPGEEASSSTKLLLVKNGEISQHAAICEQVRFKRDRFGIKYPTRLNFVSEDDVRLRVKPLRLFDSGFYTLRAHSEMNLTLRDGKLRKTIGITEHLVPKNMKYRLFRWFSDLKIGRNGRGSIL